MRKLLICIFTLGFNTLYLSHAQAKEPLTPTHKNQAPKAKNFHSSEASRQAHYMNLETKEPAFYSLMAYLHGWETPKSHIKTNQLKTIWSKISNGDLISTDEITIDAYEALLRAKEKYDSLSQDKDNYSLPTLAFEPSDLITTMVDEGKLNLLNENQLRFYLKLYDRKLVDADADAVSANAFAQVFKLDNEGAATALHPNSSEILNKVMELEKEFHIKKKEVGAKKGTEEFKSSPLQLFSASISARMKEEITLYPKSKMATLLANSMRKLSGELNKIKDPFHKTQMANSLSLAITEIEKNSPKGRR